MNKHIIAFLATVAGIVRPCTAGLAAANIGAGVHSDGCLTRLADAVHSDRHSVVKIGSDAEHIAVCGAEDKPLGICDDAPDVAEYAAVVELLGHGPTKLMVAAEAVAAGAEVYTAAAGRVSDLSATAGTYYHVGVALTAATAAGETIEVATRAPVAVTVS